MTAYPENLVVHAVGQATGYLETKASVIRIQPWRDGLMTVGYPPDCTNGTQLPTICGLVASARLDTRFAKVRDQVVPMLSHHPETLPAMFSALEAFDEDIKQLNVSHPRYAAEVQQAVTLITSGCDTTEWHLSILAVMETGCLTIRRKAGVVA
jgi:hypothetical protein